MNQPSDHGQDGREMEQAEVRRALEAILFLADEPIGASTLAQIRSNSGGRTTRSIGSGSPRPSPAPPSKATVVAHSEQSAR